MRFASLGSGSRGNSLVVEIGRTRILVDAGFGPAEMARRLARLGLATEHIDAVIVTHEHSDHIAGASACSRRFGWSIHLTTGTLAGFRDPGDRTALKVFESHSQFAVGDVSIHPFTVPHDAREPVQFVLSDGDKRLGVLTDAGHVTQFMLSMLDGCDSLVLECNHDLAMLESGRYPPALKSRIAGKLGHLDNCAAAQLLSKIERCNLQHVIAAHLSLENNTPALARGALAAVLGCDAESIGVATQADGFGWRDIRA